MAANTFNEFKFFSSTSTKGLEEKINKFLDENSGRIKIIKRTMTIVSWGKPRTWDPVIQMVICYKKQKTPSKEMVRVVQFEQNDATKRCEDYSREMLSGDAQITDLLFSSCIADVQYSYVSCVLAVFLKI